MRAVSSNTKLGLPLQLALSRRARTHAGGSQSVLGDEGKSQLTHTGQIHLCRLCNLSSFAGPADWVDRFGSEPRKGADILVQCLEREGVDRVFAYPGGASMEIHQALTRSDRIANVLCRHEQVGGSLTRVFRMVGLTTDTYIPGLVITHCKLHGHS